MTDQSLAGVRVLFIVNVDWFFISHRMPLLRAAIERGAVVGVAAADSGRLEEIAREGVQVFPIPMSRSGTGLGEQVRVAWAMGRAVRRFRPDLVHNVTIKPVLLGTGVVRVLQRRARVIAAISGFGFAVEGEAPSLLRRSVEVAYRVLLRSRRVTVVVQNDDARASVIERRVARAERVELIEGSGVQTDRFMPASRAPDGTVRVAMASRILRDKGVVEFCRACALLGPNVDAVLAGSLDTDGNPTSMARNEVDDLCSETGVTYVGEVNDMVTFLQQADVFVLPSYHEGLPKALIEAAACGLPLVATDIAGCRPVVTPGENGELVPVRAVESLAAAIEMLVSDPDRRARYGAASRRRAVERFSIDRVVRQFMAIYERESAT